MQETTLPFMNFKHTGFKEDGVNVTVRLGDKWARLSLGQEFVAGSTKEGTACLASVIGVKLVQWQALSEADLQDEHVELARTKEGLKAILQDHYGFAEIQDDSPWTVVMFKLVKES